MKKSKQITKYKKQMKAKLAKQLAAHPKQIAHLESEKTRNKKQVQIIQTLAAARKKLGR